MKGGSVTRRVGPGRQFVLGVFLAVIGLFGGIAVAVAETRSQPAVLSDADYDRLFEEMMKQPGDLDLMFAFAGAAAARGDYNAAIGTYERMLLLAPDLPRVRLELGALYYRIGAVEIAREYLTEVKAEPDLPPAVRGRVEAMLADIDRAMSRHHVGWSAFAGVRHQSNATAGPSSPNVRALGFDAVLDREFTARPDWSGFVSGAVTHAYDLDTQHGEMWETRALGYMARQRRIGRLDLDIVELETGPHLALLPQQLGPVTVRPYLLANAVRLGRDPLFWTASAGARFVRPVGGSVLLGGALVVRHKEFQRTGRRPNAHFQTAQEYEGAIDASWLVTDRLVARAGLGLLAADARRNWHDRLERRADVAVDYAFPTPLGLSRRPSRIGASVERVLTSYRAPDPLVDPNVKRREREWRFGVSHSLSIGSYASLELQVTRSTTGASLPNFKRDNWSTLAGVAVAW